MRHRHTMLAPETLPAAEAASACICRHRRNPCPILLALLIWYLMVKRRDDNKIRLIATDRRLTDCCKVPEEAAKAGMRLRAAAKYLSPFHPNGRTEHESGNARMRWHLRLGLIYFLFHVSGMLFFACFFRLPTFSDRHAPA